MLQCKGKANVYATALQLMSLTMMWQSTVCRARMKQEV